MINSSVAAPAFLKTTSGGYVKTDSIVYMQQDSDKPDECDIMINDGSQTGLCAKISSKEAKKLIDYIA